MLLVKTKVLPSPIPDAGLGLFADEDLPAGTKIWEEYPVIDIKFDSIESLGLSEESAKQITAFSYYDITRKVWILCGDNARFMNHSEDPNCNDLEPGITTTIKDIKKGDELTVDYRTFHTGDLW